MVVRIIRMVFSMSSRWYTVDELSKEFSVCKKTVRRDMGIMECSGIPLMQDRSVEDSRANIYSVDRHWAKKFNGVERKN